MSSGPEIPNHWHVDHATGVIAYTGPQPWGGGTDAMSTVQALHLILDVLRANNLHQTACRLRLAVEENNHGMSGLVEVPPCDCWLKEQG